MKNIVIILLIFIMFSCEDIIDIDPPTPSSVLVVDGNVTTEEGPYHVTLSKTGPYFDNVQTSRVRDAVVVISDNEGRVDTLYETVPGEYYTRFVRKGKTGNTYTLEVKTEGQEYYATTEIKRVPPIDSLTVQYTDEPGTEDDGYYLLYHGPETAGVGDYYKFKITVNDTLINRPENVQDLSSDEMVDGKYIGSFEVYDEPLHLGDKVKAEVNSITRDHYYFYTELGTQVNNGGMFANPPANIRSNIKNRNPYSASKAIGYFGGCGISSREIIVGRGREVQGSFNGQ